MPYTATRPMPDPLLSAMTSLTRHGARIPVDGTYPGADGHHLTATSGPFAVHVVLALDHYADGIEWADGELTWTAILDDQPLTLDRWSDVVAAVRQHAPPGTRTDEVRKGETRP